jgi:hypothetical protein
MCNRLPITPPQVAAALKDFPVKITNDKEILKQVAALKGVGKGSMEKVKGACV